MFTPNLGEMIKFDHMIVLKWVETTQPNVLSLEFVRLFLTGWVDATSWELNCFPLFTTGMISLDLCLLFLFYTDFTMRFVAIKRTTIWENIFFVFFFQAWIKRANPSKDIPYQRWGLPFPKEFRNLADHPNSRKVPVQADHKQSGLDDHAIFWKTKNACFNNSGH